MCHSTRMIPFRLLSRPGVPIYEQVVYSAKRAIVAGRLREGDPFPSVRMLAQELRINPNTAHKVVTQLIDEGLLEPRPGIGTVVASIRSATASERTQLLNRQIEELVVEAKRLSIDLEEVTTSLARHWKRLSISPEGVAK
jgi:GntR family transcriptional regulator